VKISHRTAALANLAHWRAGQGRRIRENRPVEVYRACDYTAQCLAPIRDPLELTSEELAICVKRAVTQERNRVHGPLMNITADQFWEQISVIAERWGIKTTRDQWERSTKGETKKEAA
jgi:hypothetical protein